MTKVTKKEVLNKKDLLARIEIAANQVGIDDISLSRTASDKGWQSILGSDIILASGKKIGYLYPSSGEYTSGSFHYNHEVFSEGRLEQFLEALRTQGLQPQQYDPLSTLHHTEADFVEPLYE